MVWFFSRPVQCPAAAPVAYKFSIAAPTVYKGITGLRDSLTAKLPEQCCWGRLPVCALFRHSPAEVHIYPTCTNIGFATRALSRGDRIWRKGTTKFSCSPLVVDIWRCRTSNCAGKPPVSKVRFGSTLQGKKKNAVHQIRSVDLHLQAHWQSTVAFSLENMCQCPSQGCYWQVLLCLVLFLDSGWFFDYHHQLTLSNVQ